MDEPTPVTLLCRLQSLGVVPAEALLVPHKSRADWIERGLLLRLAVRRGPHGNIAWTMHVGDPLLGRPFHDGGILALVPIREVGDDAQGPLLWPRSDEETDAAIARLAPRAAAARGFVADRADLCQLLMAPGDVQRGDLYADLHADLAERVVRALAIAAAAGAQDVVDQAVALLHEPPGALLNQARVWADQWTWQSGHPIVIPEPGAPVATPPDAGVDRQSLSVEDFWDRLG